MKKTIILISLCCLFGCQLPSIPISTVKKSGYEFSDKDILTAVGMASVKEQKGRTLQEKQLQAMRASKVNAYKELAEQVYGLKLNANVSMKNDNFSQGITKAQTQGVIRGAKVLRSYKVKNVYFTEMQLNLATMQHLDENAGNGAIYVPITNQQSEF